MLAHPVVGLNKFVANNYTKCKYFADKNDKKLVHKTRLLGFSMFDIHNALSESLESWDAQKF